MDSRYDPGHTADFSISFMIMLNAIVTIVFSFTNSNFV